MNCAEPGRKILHWSCFGNAFSDGFLHHPSSMCVALHPQPATVTTVVGFTGWSGTSLSSGQNHLYSPQRDCSNSRPGNQLFSTSASDGFLPQLTVANGPQTGPSGWCYCEPCEAARAFSPTASPSEMAMFLRLSRSKHRDRLARCFASLTSSAVFVQRLLHQSMSEIISICALIVLGRETCQRVLGIQHQSQAVR